MLQRAKGKTKEETPHKEMSDKSAQTQATTRESNIATPEAFLRKVASEDDEKVTEIILNASRAARHG